MISWCSVTTRGQLIPFVSRYLRCMFLLQAFHEWCGTAWYGTCGSFHSAHCGHGNGLLVTWYSDDFTWTWPPPHARMVLWSAYSGFAREVQSPIMGLRICASKYKCYCVLKKVCPVMLRSTCSSTEFKISTRCKPKSYTGWSAHNGDTATSIFDPSRMPSGFLSIFSNEQ